MFRILKIAFPILVLAFVSACANKRPQNIDNICEIFRDKPGWYKAAKKSSARWGGSIQMPMAIMYQESGFRRKARPPMQYFLGFIPKGRASDAYGYSQALQSTWKEYEKEAGSAFSSRTNFANAFDFIQWYMDKTYQRNQVAKSDGYGQYLNYHEGHGGYARGSYRNKQWLINVAQKVDQRSKKYAEQIKSCRKELDSKRGWF